MKEKPERMAEDMYGLSGHLETSIAKLVDATCKCVTGNGHDCPFVYVNTHRL